MDATRQIQVAVAHVDLMLLHARAALPALILAAALIVAAVLMIRRRYHK